MVEILEQARRVVTDAEEPLLEQALLNLRPAALAEAAGHDLLVGEDGFAAGAPVDGGGLSIGEPLLEQLEKEPLRPLVVVGIGGGERVPPVHHQPRAFKLSLEVGNVARDQIHRMHAYLEGVVLRMNPECVITERLEHVVSDEALESSINVVPSEGEEIPDVEAFRRRIREHHQCIERPLGALQIGVVGAALLPDALPLPLDRLRVVSDDGRGQRVIPCCRIFHLYKLAA